MSIWGPRLLLVLLIVVLAMFTWPEPPRPTSAEIRLDTGDLRCLIGDEVLEEEPMTESYRTILLSAAGESPVLRNEWHRCATFPIRGSNRSHRMCQRFYRNAAVWIDTDRRIGIQVAEDIARYIESIDAVESLPNCHALLRWVVRQPDGRSVVADGWKEDEMVKQYLIDHDLLEP